MHTGTQLNAPDGYGELEKGQQYHLLRNDVRRGLVYLVSFPSTPPRTAALTVLKRDSFEDGLASGAIVFDAAGRDMPPWLEPFRQLDLHAVDATRCEADKAKTSHIDLIERRHAHLHDAIDHIDEIFASEDPFKEINRYARKASPPQNEGRFRNWLLVYLVFGRSILSLWPALAHHGRWSRDLKPKSKFGRPSHKGKTHGFPCDAVIRERIQEGFRRFAKRGATMSGVYALAMTYVFECKTRTTFDDDIEYFHPQGEPFPSEHQWRYWCFKLFGREGVQEVLCGEQKQRQMRASKGRFSQAVCCLMEVVEADAYSTRENPRGFSGDHVMPKLYVVRIVCVLSAVIVGIGFSLGSETGAAYATALFCCAIGKKKFCALFGLAIENDEWPCIGLPTSYTPDRGPGSSQAVVERLKAVTAECGLTPSYTPQSHGTVESSHPRSRKIPGKPTYIRSNLNPVGLAKQEINQVLVDNKTSSAVDRLTPEMVQNNVRPTPLGIWRYLDERGRNDAQTMPFDVAVRTFLSQVNFTAVNGKLYLEKMVYSSAALQRTGILDKLRRCPATELRGYVMELCVRHAWVEIDNRLIEVDAQLPISDNGEQLYFSLEELRRYADLMRKSRNRVDENRAPVISEALERWSADAGQRWHGGRVQAGTAKTGSPAAKREVKQIKRDRSAKGMK